MKQWLRCKLGLHERVVEHALGAATAVIKCRHCPVTEIVEAVPSAGGALVTNVEYRQDQGVCQDVYLDRQKVLVIRFDRSTAINMGRMFLNTAAKLGRIVHGKEETQQEQPAA